MSDLVSAISQIRVPLVGESGKPDETCVGRRAARDALHKIADEFDAEWVGDAFVQCHRFSDWLRTQAKEQDDGRLRDDSN